jgi:RNA polymerase sigma factor (sigma-70 family)
MTIVIAPIQEAMAGDQRAFMELLEPLLPDAYRLAVVLLKTRSEAEDAVQDAVLKAWQNFGRFRRDSPLRPWLFTIVANECRRRRRSRWWSVLSASAISDQRVIELKALDPEAADLRRAVHRLPHEQRLAIVLRYYLDLPFDEVAQVLHVSTKAAKSRIYRALEKLRLSPEVLPNE